MTPLSVQTTVGEGLPSLSLRLGSCPCPPSPSNSAAHVTTLLKLSEVLTNSTLHSRSCDTNNYLKSTKNDQLCGWDCPLKRTSVGGYKTDSGGLIKVLRYRSGGSSLSQFLTESQKWLNRRRNVDTDKWSSTDYRFVTNHDPGEYMQTYRERHTVNNVAHRARAYGDVISESEDPYLRKFRTCGWVKINRVVRVQFISWKLNYE